MKALEVYLWGMRVGAISWQEHSGVGQFEYDPAFIKSGLAVSPLCVPLQPGVFRFAELAQSRTFHGLPGFVADSLPEKFGNRLLDAYLARHGRNYDDLNPLERLCYIGTRGMGALEYYPAEESEALAQPVAVEVGELVSLAKDVLQQRKQARASLDEGLESLIMVGASAGGAKAKAVVAIHRDSGDVLSGQADAPPGYEHWLLKFDGIDNEELATGDQIGRIEYAYNKMAYAAGINVMPCRLLEENGRAHFLTRRFDRLDNNEKVHVASFAALAHADRDPPGNVGYERLFQTIRELGLPPAALEEMYRRMVFNICSRNQDDHTKNHAFVMFGDGQWQLAPAYDLCFSYKPGNPFIEQHQMSCHGKRDSFVLDDLLAVARVADVRNPGKIIDQVQQAVAQWLQYADEAGLGEQQAQAIGALHRRFD